MAWKATKETLLILHLCAQWSFSQMVWKVLSTAKCFTRYLKMCSLCYSSGVSFRAVQLHIFCVLQTVFTIAYNLEPVFETPSSSCYCVLSSRGSTLLDYCTLSEKKFCWKQSYSSGVVPMVCDEQRMPHQGYEGIFCQHRRPHDGDYGECLQWIQLLFYQPCPFEV